MITPKDSPEGILNKFMDRDGDGHRGKLVAVSKDKTSGIIIAKTSAFASKEERQKCMEQLIGVSVQIYYPEFDGIVSAENMYLVSEAEHGSYPMVVRQVKNVPENFIKIGK